MRTLIDVALPVAVATGVLIGVLTSINGAIGRVITPFNASVLANLSSGVAGAVLLGIIIMRGGLEWDAARSILPLLPVVGVGGIFLVTGVAFAYPRIGMVAASAALIMGQLVAALVIDTAGLGGYERIPFDPLRIGGLALLAVATFLVLPRGG